MPALQRGATVLAIMKPFPHTVTTFVSSCTQEDLSREELFREEVLLGKADVLNNFQLSYVCRKLEHISFTKLLKKCLLDYFYFSLNGRCIFLFEESTTNLENTR